jgi:hypothetical protein
MPLPILITKGFEREPTASRDFVLAKTAAYTVKAHQTGSTFTNLGATSSVTFTLPSNARKGNRYTFCVQAAYSLVIDPGSAGAIYFHYAKQTDDVAIQSSVIGNYVTLVSDGNNDWAVASQGGDWVLDTNALWASCPWQQIQNDPTLGHSYFNHFLNGDDYDETDGWTETQATTGTGAIINEPGGILQLDSNSGTADQGIQAQHKNLPWLLAASKDLWFETRLKVTDTVVSVQLFAGLNITDGTIIATGVPSSADYIGFVLDAGDAAASAVSLELNSSAGSEEKSAGVKTLIEDTYVRLGFHVSGVSTATPYVDGVAGTAITISSAPAVQMALSFVCQSEGVSSADPILRVDWVKVAQLA